MNDQNHYATLNVDRCATGTEIKDAYRVLAHRFHPDVSDDIEGESKFKDVSVAYRTLKVPASRIAYDRRIHKFCIGTKAARVESLPETNTFDYRVILWCYWLWFLPLRAA